MCQWCITHGDGQKWFMNTENYARKYYKLRKKEVERQGAEANPQVMAEDLMHEAIEARTIDPANYAILKKKAEQLSYQVHFGQVITLQEVQAMMEIAWPIAKMTCACRRNVRGLADKDNYYCMGLGVGMYRWERWPETYRGGIEFLSPEEAKQWLVEINKRGMVHTFWVFGTPYIGGICNCEYPVCLGIRNRIDHGIDVLIKGENVAKIDYSRCTGCGTCVERCQFGAVKMETALDRAVIDLQKCFGCGLCETTCRKQAIAMQDRKQLPLLASNW
ncbi:MAG: ATP-binding protein [Bacillota bacterium]